MNQPRLFMRWRKQLGGRPAAGPTIAVRS
jgi:hypothetical protein